MKPCFCNRFYNMRKPTAINVYAFGGSLCRVREFKTDDGSRFCLTIFSLSSYNYLHFPHDVYEMLIRRLHMHIYKRAIDIPTTSKSNLLNIKELTAAGNFEIKFAGYCMSVGVLTAIGLENTSPFSNAAFYTDGKPFSCERKWDICTCQKCPVFIRLLDFEMSARELLAQRKAVNVIFTCDSESNSI